MLICESCGQDIPEQSIHCPYCGAQCGDGPADPAGVFTQPRKGVLCPSCSQRTIHEGDYCMWCGFRLDSLAEAAEAPIEGMVTEVQGRVLDGTQKRRPSGGNAKPALVAVIVGLALALVVSLLMMLSAQQRADSLAAEAASAQAAPRDELSPAESRYLEATDLAEQGRWEDAAVMLKAALLADPRHAAARAKLEEVETQAQVAGDARRAREDLEAHDFDSALQSVNKLPLDALDRDPELVKLRARVRDEYRQFHLGEAARAEKGADFQGAEVHLLSVLAVAPEDVIAAGKLSEIREKLTKSKREKAPKATAAELAALSPELSAEQLAQKASEAFQRGNNSLAIESLQRARKLKPDDAELVRLLANVYAVQGNRAEALRLYKRYLEMCPNCVYTQTVRATIRGFEDLGQP